MTELVHEIRLSTPDFSFKGPIPDVPLAPGVDYDALISMTCPTCHGEGCAKCSETGSVPDPHPLFVVRPLGKLGAVSNNNLKYDQELLDQIREQVISKKPAGRQGHVSDANSSWEFPDDVSLWVGATQVADTLYGKAFIYRNNPFHEMTIRRKAAGSTLSNSIWGKGTFEKNADGTQRLRHLDLETIDFAPMERAALSALGGDFETTSEMKGSDMTDTTDDREQDLALIRAELAKLKGGKVKEMLTNDQRHEIASDHMKGVAPSAAYEMLSPDARKHCAETHIREMEPGAVNEMLPQSHRQHISECYAKEFAPKMESAAEMGENKQVAELSRRLSEMERENEAYRRREFDTTLDAAAHKQFATWQVRQPDGLKAIASAENNLKMYIVAEMATMEGGAKIENIAAAADSAWPKYEPQAALLKVALSGGNAIVGSKDSVSEQTNPITGWDPKTGRYTDQAAAHARGLVAPH